MNFATDYSRSFERLSRTLLAQQLAIPEDYIVLTPVAKDGGADGYSEFSLGTIAGQGLKYSLAFEAKLRSGRVNAGLDAFAKSMIIAFTAGRHGLALTTNRLFTPQCAAEAAQFHLRTGLQFIFVDGPRVSRWLRPRLKRLRREGYEDAFLMGLLWEGDEEALATDFAVPLEGPCDTGLLPLRASVLAEGPDAQEKLVARVEARPRTGTASALPSVLGDERRRTFENLRSSVAGKDGLHLLWGEAGVGKSLVIANLIHGFATQGWSISCVNIRACFTARDLFLKLLTGLLGVDLTAALAEASAGGARELLYQLLGGRSVSTRALDAAVAALTGDADRAALAPELDHSLLLNMLEAAVAQRRQSAPVAPVALLILQEVTYATPEIFDFLSRAVTILAGPGARVIVESRLHDLDGESTRNWEAFRLALRIGATSEFTLSAFSRPDARAYLSQLLPGIGPSRSDVVIARVGTVPLFLETAREFLIERGAVVVHDDRHSIVEDLETFFEGIRPERPGVLIRLQVEHWGRELEAPLHAAAILGGRLPGAAVAVLAETDDAALLDRLLATGLFEPWSVGQGVQARHGLIIDALRDFAAANPFAASRVAKRLLPIVDRLETEPLARRAREADLHATAGERGLAMPLCHEVGQIFWRQRQLEQAAHYLTQAHNLARQLAEHPEAASIRSPTELWAVLLDLLELQDQRHRLGATETVSRLADAALVWHDPLELEGLGSADLPTLRLRAGYILWRAEHMSERFSPAVAIANDLFAAAESALGTGDVAADIAGRSLAALGTTLKALGSTDQSRAAFQRALAVCPDSLQLLLQHHSNEGALSLVTRPEMALEHFDQMLALASDGERDFGSILHARIDRAMALFLMRRYDDASAEAQRGERFASANGVPAQAARARNILGCCHWVQGDLKQACREFERAILDAERSLSERFLWRMRTNIAGAALEAGRVVEAVAHARSAAWRILIPRRDQWPAGQEAVTRRWYHALVLCGAVLEQAGDTDARDAIVKDVPLPDFATAVSRAAAGEVFAAIGDASTSIHAGRIMITG